MSSISEARKYSREVVREFGFFKSQFEDTGATYGETHALIELQRFGGLEVSELARLLNIDKSQASKMLSQLRKKGWVVESAQGLSDARKKSFCLTQDGEKVTAAVEAKATAKMSAAFRELGKPDQELVSEGLRKLSRALKYSRARSEYSIRQCRKSDDREISSIVRRAIKAFGFAGPGTAAADDSLNHLSSFNAGRQRYFVAVRDGRIAGGAGFAKMDGEPDTVCELIRMFLRPEARSTGLAQLLLDRVISDAKSLGYDLIYLETTEEMKAAQRLYLKNGFRIVKSRRGNTGHFACTVMMERKL